MAVLTLIIGSIALFAGGVRHLVHGLAPPGRVAPSSAFRSATGRSVHVLRQGVSLGATTAKAATTVRRVAHARRGDRRRDSADS